MKTLFDIQIKKVYTRELYAQEFGSQPDTYNPALPPKSWVGSGAFKIFDYDKGAIVDITVPGSQDGVNIPGVKSYPAYIVAPTKASAGGSIINPIYMSMQSDAQTLMTELNGINLQQEDQPGFPTTYPADELRRDWYFILNGQSVNVGALLLMKNVNGVGAPGRWDLTKSTPVWISEQPALPPAVTLPPVGVPISLPDGAAIIYLAFPGVGWVVQMPGDQAPGTSPASGGAASDSLMAQETNRLVKAIAAIYHIS